MESWSSFVPTEGGWGEVRTSMTSVPVLLVVVVYGSAGNAPDCAEEGLGLEHAVDAQRSATARPAPMREAGEPERSRTVILTAR
jgi:hypothetical protein